MNTTIEKFMEYYTHQIGILTHCGPVFFPLYLSQIINSK
jgi:hypothetical protein